MHVSQVSNVVLNMTFISMVENEGVVEIDVGKTSYEPLKLFHTVHVSIRRGKK